jgi:mono/diheme cytochrome c family protein
MTQWHLQVLAAGLLCSHVAAAQTAPTVVESRGELLYSTHCIACHTAKIHWRDSKLATDWASLKEQVRRWSTNTGLTWGDDDILAVSRHLNTLYYHFPGGDGQIGGTAASESLGSALPVAGRTMDKR